MISKKNSIILLASTMVIINFFIIAMYTAFDSRLVRNMTTISFFILFMLFGGLRQIKLTVVFLMFMFTDVCIMFYDIPIYNSLTSVFKSMGLIVMSWHLLPKFKVEFDNKKSVVGSLLIIIFSSILFMELMELASMTFIDNLHIFLYACCAIVYIILLILVVNYYIRYKSFQAILLVSFVLSIGLSDFLAFISYYLEVYMLYYPTRLSYILGLALITAYAVLPFKKRKYL